MDVSVILPDLEPVSGIRVLLVIAPGLGNRIDIGICRDFVAQNNVPILVEHGTTIHMRYRHLTLPNLGYGTIKARPRRKLSCHIAPRVAKHAVARKRDAVARLGNLRHRVAVSDRLARVPFADGAGLIA
jgi:hypothetical protein